MGNGITDSVGLLIGLTIAGIVAIAIGMAMEYAVLVGGGLVFLILPIFAIVSELINSLK